MSNNTQSQKQLREVTELLNSYQQKISIYNEEIDLLKSQLVGKDKDLDQMRIQLKNLKRSKSSDSSYDRNRRFTNSSAKPNDSVNNNEEKSGEKQDPNKTSNTEESNADRKQRSMSVDTSETLSRQVEIANDEVRLLRNKIARLEDDLLIVTQVIYFI